MSQARQLTPARVDEIGQGRVWEGGTAHQLGLVDRFGGLQDAMIEAAKRAGLKVEDTHAEYLEKKPSRLARFIAGLTRDNDDDDDSTAPAQDAFTRVAAERRAMFATALGEVRRIGTGAAVQARCLECSGLGGASPSKADERLMDVLLARFGW